MGSWWVLYGFGMLRPRINSLFNQFRSEGKVACQGGVGGLKRALALCGMKSTYTDLRQWNDRSLHGILWRPPAHYPLHFFQILLHHPSEYPNVDSQGFVVSPGTETFVSVKLARTVELPEPYEDANCWSKPKQLKYFRFVDWGFCAKYLDTDWKTEGHLTNKELRSLNGAQSLVLRPCHTQVVSNIQNWILLQSILHYYCLLITLREGMITQYSQKSRVKQENKSPSITVHIIIWGHWLETELAHAKLPLFHG